MVRIVTILAGFLFLCGCSRTPDDVLTVGMELAYPPFEMTDAQGEPSGVSVDLARALGAHLGREVVIENTPFDGLIPSLKTGRIDLIISSMTATPERSKSIDFSEPYVHTGLAMLAAAGTTFETIEEVDQPGRKVAVKLGTTGHAYAREHLAHAELLVLNEENACVLEVIQGKVDVFFYDQLSVYRNWQRNPEQTRAILAPFQKEAWAVALRQGDDALRDQVNGFLSSFRADGGFDRLADTYLDEMKAAFEELGYPFVF